jgi:hypothetical protein
MQKVEKIRAYGWLITMDSKQRDPKTNSIPVTIYKNGQHIHFPSVNKAYLHVLKESKSGK